jgi:hypothetical protein
VEQAVPRREVSVPAAPVLVVRPDSDLSPVAVGPVAPRLGVPSLADSSQQASTSKAAQAVGIWRYETVARTRPNLRSALAFVIQSDDTSISQVRNECEAKDLEN